MASPRPTPNTGFSSIGVSDTLAAAVAALGYEEPTPVQRETIPVVLAGRDLLAQAATGTGKTAAFALPMIQLLSEPAAAGPGKKKAPAPTSGIVLVPTRELAMQVSEAIHKYAAGTGVTVVPVFGGSSMEQQIRALARGAHIVVATPGRALDHIRRQTLVLDGVRLLVLDEADEMLDMGFAEDIETILQGTPDTRQTALFSATLPKRILQIADRHLRNPTRIAIAAEKAKAGAAPRVRQVAYLVRRDQKAAALDRILDMEQPTSAIVFCRTRLEVDALVEMLDSHGYRAEGLHGGLMQRQRDAVMGRVRAGTTDLLVATDVAARGLDIERVSHVVNYDLPTDAESYVHRIGRTGRAGRAGTAITLVDPREHRHLRTIEHLTKQKIEVAAVPTVADLRAKRLQVTAAAVRERLTAGEFDDMRAVVAALAAEFDIMDVAAAAVKLAHLAQGGGSDEDERDIPAPRIEEPGTRSPRTTDSRATDRRSTAPGPRGRAPRQAGDMVKLFFGAGKAAGVRPGDLVGAIAGEARMDSSALGAIQVSQNFSVVDVPADLADTIIQAIRASGLRGKKVTVRRDRDTAAPARGA